MTKETIVILLGILVAVLPQLGLPADWKVILFTGFGVVLALLGFLLRGQTISRHQSSVESRPPQKKREVQPPPIQEV